MPFFETLLLLMLAAILLSQLSRRIGVPYPTMLAAAGVAVALIPGVPPVQLEPQVALALFIAPALLDAGFDFQVSMLHRFWKPLVALAVVAVALTAGTVAWIGWYFAGLPIAAAVALGAIVAPPDAAAATAILRASPLPRDTALVLSGESLFNDATALLLLSGALLVHGHGGVDGAVLLEMGLAAPGGVLLGIVTARLYMRGARYVQGTLGGNLLSFVSTVLLWVLAERLGLSAVLCVVAYAMTVGHLAPRVQHARDRLHSYGTWASVVFALNVLAFLLMGMQVRTVTLGMDLPRLEQAAMLSLLVVLGVVAVRLAVVLAYNRLAQWRIFRGDEPAPSLAQGVAIGWCGMRGIVTLAAAFSLPADFPGRDLVLLAAFATVLATLVLQGLTLGPLLRWLKLPADPHFAPAVSAARQSLLEVALQRLEGETGSAADHIRAGLDMERQSLQDEGNDNNDRRRQLALSVLDCQRARLQELRDRHDIRQDIFDTLQQELDWQQMTLLPNEETGLEEN